MRKMFGLALLLLPLMAAPTWAASAEGGTTITVPAYRFDFGGKLWFKAYHPPCNGVCGPCGLPTPVGGCANGACGPQLGPWYNYWPLEAHFQTPAVPQYPYWPPPQTLMGQGGYGQPGPANFHAPVAPAGYAPAYWYGN
jgi:hypothetical protein